MGLRDVRVLEVSGVGRESLQFHSRKKERRHLKFTTHTWIEVLCRDDRADEIVGAITEAAHTGRPGDGKVAVSEIEHLIRIRTRGKGEAALGS